MLSADSPEIVAFLEAWHENGRDLYRRSYPNNYAAGYYDACGSHGNRKTASERNKYICLDCGSGGVFMAERETGDVYGIKGYGKINRRKYLGTVASMTAGYLAATEQNRAIANSR